MKHCPKCNTVHNKNGMFCSRSCANSRPSTEEKKLKQSAAAKASAKVTEANKIIAETRIAERNKINCIICNNIFDRVKSSKRATCSNQECISKHRSNTTGGYREGSGRSNSGYYKGIYCGSTYELVWVIYRLDHNLSVTRFSGFIPYDNKKYFPDFIDGNIIYEMKGYHTEAVDAKIAGATALRL